MSFAHIKLVCMTMPLVFLTTPMASGANMAFTPLIWTICLASAN